MTGYKAPDFNERLAAARTAKQRALDLLREKPPIDPAIVAQRQAARAARDAAAAERRAARKAAAEEAKAAKVAAAAHTKSSDDMATARPTDEPKKSEAELKAARDARYAARKARKR